MRYLLLILSITGGFVSFNSYADSEKITDAQCQAKPTLRGYSMTKWVQKGLDIYAAYQGCVYLNVSKLGVCAVGNDCFGDWEPIKAFNPSSGGSGTSDTKPDTSDSDSSGGHTTVKPSTGSGSSGTSSVYSSTLSYIGSASPDTLYNSYRFSYNSSLTLQQNESLAKAFLTKLSNVTPPSYYAVDHIRTMMDEWEKTYLYLRPDNTGIFYLWDSAHFVSGEHRYLGHISLPVNSCTEPLTSYDDNGNPVTHFETSTNCADKTEDIVIPDPDYASYQDYKHNITRCDRNPGSSACHSTTSHTGSDTGSGNTGSHTSVGESLPLPLKQCSAGQHQEGSDCVPDGFHKQGSGFVPDTLPCPSGYHQERGDSCIANYNSSGSSGSSGNTGNTGTTGNSGSSPGVIVTPGPGHASSGDDGNGDVVGAINAFHADANKNHKEILDKLNVSDSDVAGIKNGFTSDINDLISSTRKEVSDSYDSAVSDLKSIFGNIDSYIPDIKLSFDLPTQFTAGIQGHCVPLVFDFNISLVGLPPYHFHAEGIQACKLYDSYIRSIVEYVFYFLTALACRRIFTRAAEFITSN
ncbi:hypothetical protein HZX00_003293 [Salmonella enterica]|nr:hypothetical protein [Salmonella enterica]